jgi:hypothetical protein
VRDYDLQEEQPEDYIIMGGGDDQCYCELHFGDEMEFEGWSIVITSG